MRGRLAASAAVAIALGIAACGGDDEGEATVGACIDGDDAVVACDSEDAEMELVSDQSAEDAVACVQIGDLPQTTVEVDGTEFCAEATEGETTETP